MNCARLLGQRTRTRVYPLSNKSVMIIGLYYFQSTSYDTHGSRNLGIDVIVL